jgi:CubicO group peptidase (beta-lactamase class C family)
MTSAKFCKKEIFEPLGMDDAWLCCGSLNPPKNVQKLLTDAFFVRASNADGQSGKFVELNKLYRSNDPLVQDDGFAIQEQGQPLKNHNCDDYLAGGYAESLVCSIEDYSKLIKLILNNGVVYKPCGNETLKIQLLSPQSIEYIFASKIKNTQGIYVYGKDTINLLTDNETWSGGFASVNNANGLILPFASGLNLHRWGSYYGQSYYFDTKTGNYLIGGTQVSLASWPVPNSTASFQPDILKIWQILTK